MSVEVPPAEEEREKTVDELLWELLVGTEDVRVDPVSGDVEPPAPKKSS